MPRKKAPALAPATKLEFRTIDGVQTIEVASTMTTRDQVDELVSRLETLKEVLPEAARARPNRSKPKSFPRTDKNKNARPQKTAESDEITSAQ